jgi:hypothetical protein
MTSRDFCFWLQGYLEINGFCGEREIATIRRRLGTVDLAHETDAPSAQVASERGIYPAPGGVAFTECPVIWRR